MKHPCVDIWLRVGRLLGLQVVLLEQNIIVQAIKHFPFPGLVICQIYARSY